LSGRRRFVDGVETAIQAAGAELLAIIYVDKTPLGRKSSSQNCLKSNVTDRVYWCAEEPLRVVCENSV